MRRHIHRLTHGLERHIDRRLGGRRRPGARVIISPYRGFGRQGKLNELLIRGRVLVEKAITRATEIESWRNMVNAYRRFKSEEVEGAKVIGRYRDAVVETVSDEEGHFQLLFQPKELDVTLRWHEVTLELPDHGTGTAGHVIVPSPATTFGIISDIDDTIVQTNATNLARMARTVLTHNAKSRLPFEGVGDLYKALHADVNPVFYVSSSPWNMYELLHDYMDLNGIPPGPMFLQDWGISEKVLFKQSHETHKLEQINTLLDFYPELHFVLIGDSGQHDPEIYLRVIQSHPGRVRAAFIRDVTPDLRDQSVALLIAEAKTAGVEMLYVRDSNEALEHARRIGIA